MKKGIVCAMLVAGCLLTACGDDEKVITGDVTNIWTQETENQNDNAGNDEAEETKGGYLFERNGVSIAIEEDAQPVLEKIEEPTSVYESASCAFGDLDRVYTYDGFEVNTYTMDEAEYISLIVIRDESVKTAEGISIGNTVEEVIDVYGEPDVEETTMLTYAKDHMKLCFFIQDDEVISIEYRNTILD